MATSGIRAELAWSRWPQALRLLVSGRTWRAGLPVCLVVGTLLSGINLGDVLVSGDLDAVTGLRVAANYVIPYVVASIGCLTACRLDPSAAPPR